jgi:hypothetical protein
MFLWFEPWVSILWLVFLLIIVYVVVIVLDNTIDRFGSFYASAMFQSTDGQKVPLQFYIKFAIQRDTYKKVFKERYKHQAHDRIIKYLSEYTVKHNIYSESDLQNPKIRTGIRSDIINRFDLEGLELINVLDAENY